MPKCKNNNSSNLEDLQVIAEVLSGNKQLYGKLITKYQKKLYNIALRITHNTDDALDITQESFLKTYYNLNKFDSNKTFLPWLIKITHNTALDHLKKRKKTIDIEPLKNIIATKESSDKRLFVEDILNKMPTDYQVIIELKHYQDLTYEQIASTLNMTVSAVKSKLFRARKQFQEMIRRYQ